MPNTNNKDKNVRLERHSAGKTPAYGTSNVRAGNGKYNWGGPEVDLATDPKLIDEKDPMYDSDSEKVEKPAETK